MVIKQNQQGKQNTEEHFKYREKILKFTHCEYV